MSGFLTMLLAGLIAWVGGSKVQRKCFRLRLTEVSDHRSSQFNSN